MRETSIRCLPHAPNWGPGPDWESNQQPSVCRLALCPLSHTSQGWTKHLLPDCLENFKEPNNLYQQISSGYSSVKDTVGANGVNKMKPVKLGVCSDKHSSYVSTRAESASRGPNWDLVASITGELHSLIMSL